MENKFISFFDKLMLRKRAIIESVNDELKNISQIEYAPSLGLELLHECRSRFDCLYISREETKLTVEKGIGFNLILISN